MNKWETFDALKKILYLSLSCKYNTDKSLYYLLASQYKIDFQEMFKNDINILGVEYDLCIIEMQKFTDESRRVIHEIRRQIYAPIFFLSGTTHTILQRKEIKYAVESGVDEYMGSPIFEEEVIARIQALIRIQCRFKGAVAVWEYRKLQIIPRCRQIFNDGEEVLLTKIEFDIICFLAQQNGRVVTYKELYETVWNREYLQDDANIMAHVHRIRQKIEKDIKKPEYIQNVYGIGYRFGEFSQ